MSKETPKDDPPTEVRMRAPIDRRTSRGGAIQERNRQNDDAKIDLEKWHETHTH